MAGARGVNLRAFVSRKSWRLLVFLLLFIVLFVVDVLPAREQWPANLVENGSHTLPRLDSD